MVLVLAVCWGTVRAQEYCLSGEECIPIRSCPSIVDLLTKAKEAPINSLSRTNIIIQVREKVCGARRDRLICCPQDDLGVEETEESGEGVMIGSFKNIFHDISGEAYALDSKTILIKGFTYDGEGPDAFFLAGTSGRPSKNGDVVLGYPFEGKHYSYDDKTIPILGEFAGDKNIILSLPPGKTVDQLKWLSVWCRDYKINFGHVNFPTNLGL